VWATHLGSGVASGLLDAKHRLVGPWFAMAHSLGAALRQLAPTVRKGYSGAMQGVEFIHAGDQLLAILVRANASSPQKYNFLTDSNAPFQLGMNFYKQGEVIPPHAHLEREIKTSLIQEVILIGHGRTRLHLFDDARTKVTDVVLEMGDLVLLVSGGHGFDIMDDTKILEVKQGPYDGKVKDKVVFGGAQS
jgi:hypothetical protein